MKAPHGAASATLTHLARVFATRHADVWKVPDTQAWLLRCGEYAAAAAAAAAAGAGAAAAADVPPAVLAAMLPAADARALAEVTYPQSAVNEYHFLEIAHFSDARPTLPPELSLIHI